MALLSVIMLPLSVQAGFFSTIFGTAGADEVRTEVFEYVSHNNAQNVALLKAAIHTDPNPAKGGGDIILQDGALVSDGGWGEETNYVNKLSSNGEISIYPVKPDDTLSQIAEMFGVSEKTILWANEIKDPDLIQPGDELTILPITGVQHVVKDGDTIGSIAKKYEGDVEDILTYNRLASADEISVGDTVIIPGGAVAAPKRSSTYTVSPVQTSGTVASGGGSSDYLNPVPGSVRSQGLHGYNGIDLAADHGTPVLAAASGEVIVSKLSGWNGGYGLYVVIKHPNGTQTLYAHLSTTNVSVGQSVVAGQMIGRVGSTGRSTGNHLHFEVRGARNPF